MNKIVITGPECCGKTLLTQSLAERFAGVMVPEYARAYLSLSKGKYDESDFTEIVKGQRALEDAAEGLAPQWVFQDTGYFVLLIWSQLKFGRVNPTLSTLYRDRWPDHYILCSPDVPWLQDDLRENPDDRWSLFYFYHRALIESRQSFLIVRGSLEERVDSVIKYLSTT